MAIEKKLIHFSKLSDFETQLNAGNILDYSIVFIQDAKMIWTHGQYYDCNGGNGTSDSPTFLRIGDADDEAKANFIAVANREKSADYYICASSIQNEETNGIVSSIVYNGPSTAPISVEYTFYGTPMKGSNKNKLLKITTILTVSTGVITTTYEDVLDAKQDTITDLETIREGAAKGATSVQPDDISEFITVEIADFDVLSLIELTENVNEGIQVNKQAIIDALAANKIVLVPYEISDNTFYRGYASLVGYVEDLLYFKVITDSYEIIVETSLDTPDILAQQVTLRDWSSKQDRLISGANIKTINGNSILGSGDITISGGEDIRYFTEFTLTEFIQACNNADTLTSVGLYNAIINNKIICIPSDNDSGYNIVNSSYTAPNSAIAETVHSFQLSLEYYQSTYLASTSTNNLEKDTLEGSVTSRNPQVIFLSDPIVEWNDNCIYYISNVVDELTIPPTGGGSYGTTIQFKTGENTVITFYANEVLWPNGVMPEIEPHTLYELSFCSNTNDGINAVLVPFKSV